MKVLIQKIKKKIQEAIIYPLLPIYDFYHNGKEDIINNNISMIRIFNMLSFFAVGILIIITPLFITGWKPLVGHINLLVFSFIYSIVGLLIKKVDKISYHLMQFVLYVYIFSIIVSILYISIIPYPDNSGTLLVCAMILFPVVFVIPLHESFIMLSLITLIGYLCVNKYIGNHAGTVYFNIAVGFVFGNVVSVITGYIRSQDYHARTQLVYYGQYDKLTGVYNKATVEHNFEHFFTNRQHKKASLVVIDIDDFKVINDTKGHYIGDEVLSIVGKKLKHVFQDSDIVGRIGGDEFALLLENFNNQEFLQKKLLQFNEELKDEVQSQMNIHITCSFGGITVSCEDHISYEELFKKADHLLYRAKRTGKNNCVILSFEDYECMNQNKNYMLIVDDEEVNREILRQIFKDDYEIVMANDGKDALEIVKDHQILFDVILLDLMMPCIDGYTVIKEMKSIPSVQGIPIVIISADEQSEFQMLEMGVADMIIKPFDERIVRQRVNNVMNHWHQKSDV